MEGQCLPTHHVSHSGGEQGGLRNVRFKMGSKSLVRPYPLNERQRMKKGIDWLLAKVKGKMSGWMLQERLAREIIATVRGDSPVLKLKEDAHKLAMVNRFVLFFFLFFWCLVGLMAFFLFLKGWNG